MRSRKLVTVTAIIALGLASILLLTRHQRSPVVALNPETASSRRAFEPRDDQRTPNETISSSKTSSPHKAIEWQKEFDSSHNYFRFVSMAAPYALNGDGEASRYVSKALYKCKPIAQLYAASKDPEADFNSRWAERAAVPQWLIDRAREDLHQCLQFIGNDAFTSLPQRAEGYNSIKYWMDLAVTANDPVAVSLQAGSELAKANVTTSSNSDPKALENAQAAIKSAVSSRDPAALFQVGQLLTDGRASDDPLKGFAVMIAACNIGYDCSANNDDLFHGCVQAGSCAGGSSYLDVIRKAAGEEGYAKAYGMAQQVQDALSRGDSDALQQLVQLKHSS